MFSEHSYLCGTLKEVANVTLIFANFWKWSTTSWTHLESIWQDKYLKTVRISDCTIEEFFAPVCWISASHWRLPHARCTGHTVTLSFLSCGLRNYLNNLAPDHERLVTHTQRDRGSYFHLRLTKFVQHASRSWACYHHKTQYQPRGTGLKRPLDNGTPMTATKGQLGTKDLDQDWWPHGCNSAISLRSQGPSANRLKPCWHKLHVPIHVVDRE